jgi:hypothetical protein
MLLLLEEEEGEEQGVVVARYLQQTRNRTYRPL